MGITHTFILQMKNISSNRLHSLARVAKLASEGGKSKPGPPTHSSTVASATSVPEEEVDKQNKSTDLK